MNHVTCTQNGEENNVKSGEENHVIK